MMSTKMSPETQEYQKKMADYCRTGHLDNLTGITPNRIHHYHRLVNNVIYSTLQQAYPITYKLLTDNQWQDLLYDFFTKHDSKTPQVWKMPYEFYQYISSNKYSEKLGKPYLNDLLYFEWIEIEIHCMEDIAKPKSKLSGNFKKDRIIFNPEHQIIPLRYPVHITIDESQLENQGNYYVMAFRDYQERDVHFINLGIVPAIFISLLIEKNILFDEAFDKTSESIGMEIPDNQKENMLNLLENLKSQGVILGFQS